MGTAGSVQSCQVPVGCQLCQGQNSIQWKCLNCQFLMCTSCKEDIHLRIAKDHKIINIKDIELDSDESFNFSDTHCNEHSSQVCCSYCSTCKKGVCLKCVMTVHNGNKFVDEEEFLSKKNKLWEGEKSAEKKIDELVETESKLREIKESEETMCHKTKQVIQEKTTRDLGRVSRILLSLDEKMHSVNQTIDKEFKNIDPERLRFQADEKGADIIKTSKSFSFVPINSNFVSITKLSKKGHISNVFTVDHMRKMKDSGAQIQFRLTKQYITEIRKVNFLSVLADQILLISDSRTKLLQHVKINGGSLQVLSNFPIRMQSMSVSPLGDILLSCSKTQLMKLNIEKRVITISAYNVDPLETCGIHVTKDQKVIIGAKSPGGHKFPVTGRRVVIVMDNKGKYLKEYEYDRNKRPLFSYPRSITSTNTGNIFVVDRVDDESRGRVVVLGHGGEVIKIYSGNPDFNAERKAFRPADILTLSSDRIIVTDMDNDSLHILNNDGQLITLYNLLDIGINHPYSLAMSSSGHVFLGCSCKQGSPDTYKAKIFELKYFEI